MPEIIVTNLGIIMWKDIPESLAAATDFGLDICHWFVAICKLISEKFHIYKLQYVNANVAC